MTTAVAAQEPQFCPALIAPGRSPEIPESADVYGWLVGSWELEVYDHVSDETIRRSKGEVHFWWVLEGRAVQDVWIMPPRSERAANPGKPGNRYGTTFRVWDSLVGLGA